MKNDVNRKRSFALVFQLFCEGAVFIFCFTLLFRRPSAIPLWSIYMLLLINIAATILSILTLRSIIKYAHLVESVSRDKKTSDT